MAQLSHPYTITGKTIALTIQTLAGKVISLLFNMLFRFIITFLPRSEHLLISWQTNGETMETVSVSIFLASKIIPDGDCSHEIKRCLILGRKSMINLDSIFKSRDVTLLTNFYLVKGMIFTIVMYGCES